MWLFDDIDFNYRAKSWPNSCTAYGMRNTILALILFIVSGTAGAYGASEEHFVLDDDSGFDVRLEPESDRVEVTQRRAEDTAPSQLKLRIFRKENPPIEVSLQALEPRKSPQRYVGRTESTYDSYVGLELEFSFDGKSWKKLAKKNKK